MSAAESRQEPDMPKIDKFKGFFSYSHHDLLTDPKLIQALTTSLERRVTGKMTNASFEIWRDMDLGAGEKWNKSIEDAIQGSNIFIILITPKWFESAYCRKEYQIFADVEDGVGVGEYVVPLLAKTIEKQIKNFDSAQMNAYISLNERQYKQIIAADFLALSEDKREELIDAIADDIEGMIERLRQRSSVIKNKQIPIVQPARPVPVYDVHPHNFNEVDFVSAAEVLVEPPEGNKTRAVFAQISFIERLYVRSAMGRVNFGVRRAYLSIDDGGSGKLSRNEEWADASPNGASVYYVNYRDMPHAITVCINPTPGKKSLSELPLPPAKNENYLSKPAVAAADADISNIRAYLSVSFCVEGLHIAGEDWRKPSPAVTKKIAAIIGVYTNKEKLEENLSFARRSIPVRERTR